MIEYSGTEELETETRIGWDWWQRSDHMWSDWQQPGHLSLSIVIESRVYFRHHSEQIKSGPWRRISQGSVAETPDDWIDIEASESGRQWVAQTSGCWSIDCYFSDVFGPDGSGPAGCQGRISSVHLSLFQFSSLSLQFFFISGLCHLFAQTTF